MFLFVEFRLYQWLRRNTVDRLTLKHVEDALDVDAEVAWQERQGVETALSHYLDDMPSMSSLNAVSPCQRTFIANIVFVHGPQGSGKSKMLSRILQDKKRYNKCSQASALIVTLTCDQPGAYHRLRGAPTDQL